MTNQELAQEVATRLWAAEAAAEKAGEKKRLRMLKRAHTHMSRAQGLLLASGDMVQPLSGGLPKN